MTLFLSCLFTSSIFSQVNITKSDVSVVEKFIDVTFTDAERDSMLNEVLDNMTAIKAVHSQHLDNWVTPALYFDPMPAGMVLPKIQKPIKWASNKVEMPKNKADLAFYTVSQLSSLIKNKKISSVELTKFFIERLKKYSDTLHCVISLTEETALQQAKQADDELAKGKYRGLLHGIPYGVKDLIAVKGTKTTWGAAPYKNQTID